MRVLDLDMDYFMTEIASTPFSCEERLDEDTLLCGGGIIKRIVLPKENIYFSKTDESL